MRLGGVIHLQPQRGQIAIGLAVAFVGIFTTFAFVMRSALTVREKIHLQAAIDRAALIGAQRQREVLNEIRQENAKIESAFQFALNVVNMPIAGPGCTSAVAIPMTRVINSAISSLGRPDLTVEPGLGCAVSCTNLDRAFQNLVIAKYEYEQKRASSFILYAVEKANREHALPSVETVILEPRNQPLRQRLWLEKVAGKNAKLADVLRLKSQGSLRERYEIDERQAQVPLFLPKLESKTVVLNHFKYVPDPTLEICHPSISTPSVWRTQGKVVQSDSHLPSFTVGVQYQSESLSFIAKLPLKIRQAFGSTQGKPLTDLEGREIPLIDKPMPMTAYAMAMPYGGSLPQASTSRVGSVAIGIPNVISLIRQVANFRPDPHFEHASLGKIFSQVRLVGIADEETHHGSFIPLRRREPILGIRKNLLGWIQWDRKDFLH